MTFEQLQEINYTHFDEDILEELSEDILYRNDLYTMFRIVLIYRYMIKLNQVYDLGLQFTSINTIAFRNIRNEDFDDFIEFICDYRYECESIFFEIVSDCGFEIIQFPTDICFWDEEVSDDSEDTFDNLISCLKGMQPGWEEIIDDLKDCIGDSVSYLEGGEGIILRTNNEWYFTKICFRYENIIKQYLSTEKEEIIKAMEYSKYPLVLSYQSKEGKCGEYSYCYFDTGCDGYASLDFSVLNWNWVIGSIILKNLLDDFYSKLKDYIVKYGLEETD